MDKLLCISEPESAQIIGGSFWPPLIAGLIIAATVEIISDWDNFKNGIAGRLESRKL